MYIYIYKYIHYGMDTCYLVIMYMYVLQFFECESSGLTGIEFPKRFSGTQINGSERGLLFLENRLSDTLLDLIMLPLECRLPDWPDCCGL